MPWDSTERWVGKLEENGSIAQPQRIAGSAGESIFQPEWSPDGTLHFVSDRIGWWNLYRWQDGSVVALREMEAEFGVPQWVFGYAAYAFVSPRIIICSYIQDGAAHLGRLDTTTGRFDVIGFPYSKIQWVKATPEYAVFICSSPTEFL